MVFLRNGFIDLVVKLVYFNLLDNFCKIYFVYLFVILKVNITQ